MPPDDQPNPSTLRPDNTQDTTDPTLGRGYVPDVVSKEQGKSVTQRALDDWNKYKMSTGADETGGRVSKLVWVPAKTSGSRYEEEADGGAGSGGGGEYKWLPDPEGQQLFERLSQVQAENSQFLKDSGAGAGRSYVATEGDKQDEVTRQFKDFLARAKGTYDLMESEQGFAANTDKMNIGNERAVQAGYMPPGSLPSYGHRRGPGLSSIIEPSLPNYLSPDYRMNQAVGLGGPEGFNDPDYDEYGMPMYSAGTDPMADPALAGIPPELLKMVGQVLFVPMSDRKEPPKAWPWGYVA